MAEYRVGVIGHTGRGDYGHGLDIVWQAIPNCRILAVADADADGRAAAAERLHVDQAFAVYREMLDRVSLDIVSIGPRWIDQHRDMAIACAERGIHIYMEKPFCRTLAEADEIVAACERHQVKLAVAFQTRYSPKLPVVRQLLEEGAIGRILELRGRGKEDQRGGGEDLWVLGSHVMNLMHHFAGEPKWCFAKVNQDQRDLRPNDVMEGNEGLGPLAGDDVEAMFGFAERITGYFGSQRRAGPGGTGRFGLRILGSEGQIELLTGHLPDAFLLADPLWSPGRSRQNWIPITSAGLGKPEPLKDGGLDEGNRLACIDLLESIEQDRLPEANVYEARTTVEMIMAVFASQVAGGPVTLPRSDRSHPLKKL
jgi:predicted dehydrogenase